MPCGNFVTGKNADPEFIRERARLAGIGGASKGAVTAFVRAAEKGRITRAQVEDGYARARAALAASEGDGDDA